MLKNNFQNKIGRDFYLQDTLTVSKKLLGKYLVRKFRNIYLAGKIVETEAYLGDTDPACHAFGRITPRNQTLYEEGGIAYVYFIYGNYYCFNVVTEKKGIGAAVLIRALEPVSGISIMKLNRNKIKNDADLTNGPAKLCLSLNIDKKFNGADLTGKEIFIAGGVNKEKTTAVVTKRIGIVKGADLPYRFFIKGNPYITKHKLNKEILSEISL
ncbi:MAG: DNA-3-methyladenine glycosylase [Ignavibacteria bacterium]|nr:DNA-3-methyladenine glycosylase [Ignavibacteria bacterium]